jgi:anti-anti-sigma factor
MTLDQNVITGELVLAGSLDIDVARQVGETIAECLNQSPQVTLNLAGVESCDAAGLQVLLSCRKQARVGGVAIRFSAVSEALGATAAALGFSWALAEGEVSRAE